MIDKATFDFLVQLSKNNNRDWFNDNRKQYELARDNFAEFINEVIVQIQKFDPFIVDANAKNTVFRIFRDVRFGKNKDPYKTNFGAAMCKGGRKSEYPGYYLHIKPNGESFVGGGVYHPQANVLNAIRKEIAFNQSGFEKIIHAKSFQSSFGVLQGDELKRPPKGFDKDHPAIEHLKRKDFLMLHKIPDNKVCAEDFKAYCLEKFKLMLPLNEFMRGPVYDVLNADE